MLSSYCRLWLLMVMAAPVLCRGLRSAEPPVVGPDPHYASAVSRLQGAIEREIQDKRIPALSIALVDGQSAVWAAGFGVADEKSGRRADANTVYRVGSVSKLLTDVAVMQLVERGELDLDAPVADYLDDFRPTNPFPQAVTLRHLMSHRAGLVREPPTGHYFDANEPTLAETVQSLNETTLVYPPGERTKYSNAGIAVVGYILERKISRPFPEYMRAEVLERLGMTTASFVPLAGFVDQLAEGWMWTYEGRQFVAPTFLLGTNAAGNLYASALDLAHFSRALFRANDEPDSQPLRKATLEQMWTPQFETENSKRGFGLGFFVSSWEGRRRIGHGGAVYGHATHFAALPDDQLAVAVVANKDVANGVVDRLADHALRLMLAVRAGASLPEFEHSEPLPAERVRRLAGYYSREGEHAEILTLGSRAWLRDGEVRSELRMRGDAVVADDVFGVGPRLEFPDDETLHIGDRVFRRTDSQKPPACPDRWRELVGEYGWDHNTLYVLECHGRLHALIEWFFDYPLTEVDEHTFRFPDDSGLYHGEQLVFGRDAQGRVRHVRAAGVLFPRREERETGGTFRILPVGDLEQLRTRALAAVPPAEAEPKRAPELVDLARLDTTLRLEIRYATTNNFLGTAVYTQPRAFLQKPAAEALLRAHRQLESAGYGLLIHDAYRPWHITKLFYEATPDDLKRFVADPAQGSRHNRGAAVDLTLYDLPTNAPVRMPSGYDEFTARAAAVYPGGTTLERWQRDLLRRAMESQGFAVYEHEWWHFDYDQWRQYPLGNDTFEELDARRP